MKAKRRIRDPAKNWTHDIKVAANQNVTLFSTSHTYMHNSVRSASVFPMSITLCYKRFENLSAVKILEYDAEWSGGGYQRFGGNTASISGIPHRTFVLHGHSWQQTMWHVTWSRRLRNVIVWHDIIRTTDRQHSVTLLTLVYGSDTVFTNRTNTRPSLSELRGPAAPTLWQQFLVSVKHNNIFLFYFYLDMFRPTDHPSGHLYITQNKTHAVHIAFM